MSQVNKSNFWVRNRPAFWTLLITALVALIVGCGGGGGGGGTTGITGSTNATTGTTGTVPHAPTGLNATPGNAKVTLSWTASAGATSYTVERSTTNGGPYTVLANFVSGTNFLDNTASNGTTYFYVVEAVNAVGPSGFSNQASAQPGSGVIGASWLPPNTIFYTAADSTDATATDLRTVSPNGSGDALFQMVPTQFAAVAANPNVQNQLVFAFTTSANPGSDPNALYSIYRNTSVSLAGATQLTDSSTLALSSVGTIFFTPDGQKMLFTGAVGSDHALYIMDSNGSNLTRLVSADDAALSPDGTKIIFSQSQGAEDDLLWMGISETSGHAFITSVNTDEIMPQWSKDGTKIAYAAKPAASLTAPYDIFVVPFGGGTAGTPVQVTSNGDFNFSPSFSPDGSQVAYDRLSTVDVTQSGVYKSSSAGGSEASVILNPGIETGLYWTSSNGRAIGGIPFSTHHTLKKLYLPHRGS